MPFALEQFRLKTLLAQRVQAFNLLSQRAASAGLGALLGALAPAGVAMVCAAVEGTLRPFIPPLLLFGRPHLVRAAAGAGEGLVDVVAGQERGVVMCGQHGPIGQRHTDALARGLGDEGAGFLLVMGLCQPRLQALGAGQALLLEGCAFLACGCFSWGINRIAE